LIPFTVEGPVLAEILVLTLHDGEIRLTGPCGPAPWLVEVYGDPTEAVAALTRRNLGDPLVAHSTSWRRDRDAVVLTYVAVMAPDDVAALDSVSVDRAELARGDAVAAPQTIASAAVIEHALRHLAWLIRDDPVVAEQLGPPWVAALHGYVPEPFRAHT
jgi:hypothetical protein